MKLVLSRRRTVTTTPEAGMEPSKLFEASAVLPVHQSHRPGASCELLIDMTDLIDKQGMMNSNDICLCVFHLLSKELRQLKPSGSLPG